MSENKTDEPKLDLILSLVQTQNELIKRLENQLSLKNAWSQSKWLTTGQLAELTNNKVGTITAWIARGKIPFSICKKVIKGKSYKYLIDSRKGPAAIESLKQGIEYKEGGNSND